jgi:hypothetical protein
MEGFFVVVVVAFGGTRVWTQGYVLAEQVVILETGSLELFAQAGLQPWSSWFQPPK